MTHARVRQVTSSFLSVLLMAAAPMLGQPAVRLGHDLSAELSTRQVDASVEAVAAHGSGRAVAQALAGARVPVGIVLSEGQFYDFGRRRAEGATGQIDLSRALAPLAQRGDFSAREIRGTLVLQSTTARACAEALSARLSSFEASGAAYAVQDEISRVANGDPPPEVPRGLVSGGGYSPRESSRLLVTPVTLMLRDVSVLEALAELVLQVPGLGWAAREDTVLAGPERNARRPSCVLELLDQHGMTSSDVVLRPRRGPTR